MSMNSDEYYFIKGLLEIRPHMTVGQTARVLKIMREGV